MLDAIKRETALIRGTFYGTMLRNEIFDFSQIGTFVERADNTARILDVKYYVLLPSISWVGSSLDNYQWESILRSVAAHRSYRWVYEADYRPTNIADYLILNGRMPRSLAFCYRNIAEHPAFPRRGTMACATLATTRSTETLAKLKVGSIKDIFDTGLHEFLDALHPRQQPAGRRGRRGLPVLLRRGMRLKITHRTEYRYDAPVALRAAAAAGWCRAAAPRRRSARGRSTIEGAREEVRFADHFGNDTRLISVEGEPQADQHRGDRRGRDLRQGRRHRACTAALRRSGCSSAKRR